MSVIPSADSFTSLGRADAAALMLSPLEWKVVALAISESRKLWSAGGEAGPVGRFLRGLARTLFGFEGTAPLADPRLETLRRFVFLTRRGHRDAMALGRRLIEQGYSACQLRAVQMRIAA